MVDLCDFFFGEVDWGRDDWVELIYEDVEENFSIWDSTLVQSTNNLITNILKLIGVQLEEKRHFSLSISTQRSCLKLSFYRFPAFEELHREQ